MFDLGTFKIELTSIVNNLAKSVVTEIMSAADKCSKVQRNEEELHALVDGLCTNAINKICKIVESTITTQGDAVSERRSKFSVLTRTEPETKEDLKLSQPVEGGLKLANTSGQSQLEEQTYILIYGSAVIDAKYPLSTEVLEICDNGMNKNGATEREDVCKTLHSEDLTSLAPLTPAECLDHEYALPSSMASNSAKKKQDIRTAARKKKWPSSRRKKNRQQTTAKKLMSMTDYEHECKQCRMLFPNIQQLEDHEKRAHTEYEHECKRCRMLFPNIQQLEDHKKRVHLDCKVCGAEFSGIVKLREHEVKVHQLMPYSCNYCDKTFSHKAHRNLHVMTHTGEKTCYCDICGKGYSCISVLKTHRMTHFEKSFICDKCGKSFYHACHLNRHKLVHKEVRPYHCDLCGKRFTQAENMKKHRITHTDDKQLCAICGKSYRCLSNHMINKHSHDITTKEVRYIITCEVCGKKYPSPSQYKLHKMTHTGEKPYHCDICGKSFRLKDTLRDHKYIHTGERPYKCTTCGKTFHSTPSYRRHTSIHTGEMPYHCKECGKRFRLLTFLKAHQKTQGHLRQKMREAPAENSLEQADSSEWLGPI